MSAPANSLERQSSAHPQPRLSGGREGALDVVSLSGGLSKRWPIPGAFLGRLSGSFSKKEASSESGDLKMEGSVSSFLDLKMGCMFGAGTAPQPFSQEVKKEGGPLHGARVEMCTAFKEQDAWRGFFSMMLWRLCGGVFVLIARSRAVVCAVVCWTKIFGDQLVVPRSARCLPESDRIVPVNSRINILSFFDFLG